MSFAPLRVCIAGAGAIGTTLAARLGRSGGQTGIEISVLARGDTLAVIRNEGLALIDLEGTHRVQPKVGRAADLGEQDVIFLCAKAQDLPSFADAAAPLLGPETLIVPVVNAIPWWYFEGELERFHGHNVHAPDGRLKRRLPLDRVIGAVTYITAERPALRASTSLARLRFRQGRREETRRSVAETYSHFGEGFDTDDLKAAKRMLDEIGRPAAGA